MLIEVAQHEIDRQLETSDGHDTKALGLLAGNLAAVGFAIVLSPRWTWLWLLPMAFAAVSVAGHLFTVNRREYNFGPVVRAFYERHGATTLVEARRHLLSQLIKAIDDNNAQLPPKARAFRIGTTALVIEVMIGAALLGFLNAGVLR